MSDVGQQAFSALGGSYSLQTRLQNIRAKLSEVNSAVRKLEFNMIYLLVNPELINYTSSQSSDSNNQSESDWSPDGEHSAVMSNPRTDYGQEEFMTNPNELSGQYAENMGVRHDLMVGESEILSAIDEQKKKAHYDNAAVADHYNNTNEHPLL